MKELPLRSGMAPEGDAAILTLLLMHKTMACPHAQGCSLSFPVCRDLRPPLSRKCHCDILAGHPGASPELLVEAPSSRWQGGRFKPCSPHTT